MGTAENGRDQPRLLIENKRNGVLIMSKKAQYMLILILAVVVIVLAIVIMLRPDGKPSDLPTGMESTEAPATEAPESPGETGTETPAPGTEAPSLPLSGLVIGIDPGHQGRGNSDREEAAPWSEEANPTVNIKTTKAKCTSGTTGRISGTDEYIITLAISAKIKSTLEALGATVVMTRESHEVDLSNQQRAEIGNKANADVVLRIHCNGAENEAANGIEIYVRDKGDNTAAYQERAAYDYALASELMQYLIAETGANNRTVKRSDDYTGINWSTVPCMIIECGFLSNEAEEQNLINDAYQQKFADAVAAWLQNSTALKR